MVKKYKTPWGIMRPIGKLVLINNQKALLFKKVRVYQGVRYKIKIIGGNYTVIQHNKIKSQSKY